MLPGDPPMRPEKKTSPCSSEKRSALFLLSHSTCSLPRQPSVLTSEKVTTILRLFLTGFHSTFRVNYIFAPGRQEVVNGAVIDKPAETALTLDGAKMASKWLRNVSLFEEKKKSVKLCEIVE